MSWSTVIEPFTIAIDDHSVRFSFSEPVGNVLEIPPSFEAQLRAFVEERGSDIKGKSVHANLENMPALSSRQLGMILTVREVMKPFGSLELHNISESVKHLLRLTGTDRFFDDKGTG